MSKSSSTLSETSVEDESAGHDEPLVASQDAAVAPLAVTEDTEVIASPHGLQAELEDPWVASRWAAHGDQNVPADSAPEGVANPAAADQARGLNGDSHARIRRAAR